MPTALRLEAVSSRRSWSAGSAASMNLGRRRDSFAYQYAWQTGRGCLSPQPDRFQKCGAASTTPIGHCVEVSSSVYSYCPTRISRPATAERKCRACLMVLTCLATFAGCSLEKLTSNKLDRAHEIIDAIDVDETILLLDETSDRASVSRRYVRSGSNGPYALELVEVVPGEEWALRAVPGDPALDDRLGTIVVDGCLLIVTRTTPESSTGVTVSVGCEY